MNSNDNVKDDNGEKKNKESLIMFRGLSLGGVYQIIFTRKVSSYLITAC